MKFEDPTGKIVIEKIAISSLTTQRPESHRIKLKMEEQPLSTYKVMSRNMLFYYLHPDICWHYLNAFFIILHSN